MDAHQATSEVQRLINKSNWRKAIDLARSLRVDKLELAQDTQFMYQLVLAALLYGVPAQALEVYIDELMATNDFDDTIHGDLRRDLGLAHVRNRGDLQEATMLAYEAARLHRGVEDPLVHAANRLLSARIQYEQGMYKVALKTLREARDLLTPPQHIFSNSLTVSADRPGHAQMIANVDMHLIKTIARMGLNPSDEVAEIISLDPSRPRRMIARLIRAWPWLGVRVADRLEHRNAQLHELASLPRLNA